MYSQENKKSAVSLAPDWASVQKIVSGWSLEREKSFHLHISKEANKDYAVELTKAKKVTLTGAGLYDLFW